MPQTARRMRALPELPRHRPSEACQSMLHHPRFLGRHSLKHLQYKPLASRPSAQHPASNRSSEWPKVLAVTRGAKAAVPARTPKMLRIQVEGAFRHEMAIQLLMSEACRYGEIPRTLNVGLVAASSSRMSFTAASVHWRRLNSPASPRTATASAADETALSTNSPSAALTACHPGAGSHTTHHAQHRESG